jgi:hypothetical protein
MAAISKGFLSATQTNQPPTEKSGGDHALRLIQSNPYAGEFEGRRPAPQRGVWGSEPPDPGSTSLITFASSLVQIPPH